MEGCCRLSDRAAAPETQLETATTDPDELADCGTAISRASLPRQLHGC